MKLAILSIAISCIVCAPVDKTWFDKVQEQQRSFKDALCNAIAELPLLETFGLKLAGIKQDLMGNVQTIPEVTKDGTSLQEVVKHQQKHPMDTPNAVSALVWLTRALDYLKTALESNICNENNEKLQTSFIKSYRLT